MLFLHLFTVLPFRMQEFAFVNFVTARDTVTKLMQIVAAHRAVEMRNRLRMKTMSFCHLIAGSLFDGSWGVIWQLLLLLHRQPQRLQQQSL